MRRRAVIAGTALICACSAPSEDVIAVELAPDQIVSGTDFLTPETRALQADDFANPGFLWVDRGDQLFSEAIDTGPACISCHADGLVGLAATYPAYDAETRSVLNIEGRINQCRTKHQGASSLAYESDELLSLTAFVSHQSRGVPISVDPSGPAASVYEDGERYFQTRRGQFNLSCQQCHTENWGKRLRGDTLSQGHGNGFPAYRLEWQSMGSLQRRLRDCDTGVRAEPLPYGDPLYIAVELYLAARSNGLEMESPAVRR
nr:sulfur oxidation c-type cytochrome SoxA [Hyphomonas sp. Mor2]